jgi:competence protein ComEC
LTFRHAPLGLRLGGALLAFASGFAAAKLRTEMVRAPVLAHELRYVNVAGYIEAHELRDKGRARLTLRVLSLGDLGPNERPYRVRLSLPAGCCGCADRRGDASAAARAGRARRLRFRSPSLVLPARRHRLCHRQTHHPRRPTSDAVGPGGLGPSRCGQSRRQRPHQGGITGETGEIAAALITGERGGISEQVSQAMRDSGLAHILSISGLQMAIMARTVFWLVRALLALVPSLALRYPIKKWAAAAALVAATFYLALSGAAVPTVRSWIMMSIVLIAVMLDRPALTMRNVALAALAILLVAPESLFEPSFEMSFAAVIALVALYEWLSTRGRSLHDVSPVWVALRRGASLAGAAAATTLVASAAIAPFAVYHFHRMTHFGLIANLVAAPLVSLLIMPMALLSLLAMPFGLET